MAVSQCSNVVMDVLGLSSLSEKGEAHIQHANKNKASNAAERWICTDPGISFSDYF